jgi:hypothetical protein
MEPRPHIAISSWFASFVAMLIGLGAQALLESIIPVGLGVAGSSPINLQSVWFIDAAIRFVSFAFGGYVAVLLAGALSIRLIVLLLIVAVLGTVFVQFPGQLARAWLAVWSIAAPLGIILGAWVANARRSAA